MHLGFIALATLALVGLSATTSAAAPMPEPGLDATVAASVTSTTEAVPFEVFGTTAAALAHQLRAHAALPGANGWVATTTWQFTWSYAHLLNDDGCLSAHPSVQVNLRTTMPTWNATNTASPRLVARWTAFVDALQTHEAGHRDIALAAANAIMDMLANLPAAPTCGDLDATAQAAIDALVRAHDTAQADYDVQTQHGLRQGAVFP